VSDHSSEWLAFPPSSRFVLDPDPAWDASEVQGKVLVVELTWMPDALAGRRDELVVSPTLAEAMATAGLTGYTMGEARGALDEDGFTEPSDSAPPLMRLIPGDDPAMDLAYVPQEGLIASPRATAIIAGHCKELAVSPQPGRSTLP
jgi:hypothetical protein